MSSRHLLPALPLAAAAVLAAVSCAEGPTSTRAVPDAVEHWTVQKDGYALTLYPGFAARATLRTAGGAETELYRQAGAFRLPEGASAPASRHRIALSGGPHGQDVAVDVDDPRHQIARIDVELYGDGRVPGSSAATPPAAVLTLWNNTTTCPPDCDPIRPTGSRAPGTAVTWIDPAAPFAAPRIVPRVVRAGGWELGVDPSFASRATVQARGGAAVELFRQDGVFRLPAGLLAPSGIHQVRLRGGPSGRDATLQVRDPGHRVAGLRIHLYDPSAPAGRGARPVSEIVTIPNGVGTCPPDCG